MRVYELSTQYDSRASFYGKAQVIEDDEGDLTLQSYSTKVAKLSTNKCPNFCEVYGTYSQTTLRHIKEFLKQNGFRADNSKQIMADYGA